MVVSRFRAVPAFTAAQVFATPVTNPAGKVKPSCALAGPETPDGETFCAMARSLAVRVAQLEAAAHIATVASR